MGAFIEERLPVLIDYGSSFGESYNVQITETANGNEYRKLVHPFPRMRYDISYDMRDQQELLDDVLDLFHRCYGRFAGFRVRNLADYSTNGWADAPTAEDQELELVSSGVYQLRKVYGDVSKPALSIGRPVRTIFKPVANTTLVAIDNPTTGSNTITAWTVDTSNGQVTLAANKTRSITNVTQAAQAVITVGSHTFVAGDSVHVSGVVGMTQINGLRAEVVSFDATTITVDIDSIAFTAYSSGGTVNTHPQSGETVTGGCEFDIPCRWESDLSAITHSNFEALSTGGMEIIEILNP